MQEKAIRVLLVEDDEEDYVITRRLLSQVPGQPFELEWAGTLADGLSVLKQDEVDVALLDFSLPDSEGWEAIQKVRDHAPSVPTIFLTGLDDEAMGVESVKRGAQDYLVKGATDRKQLVRSIRYAIERKRSEEELKTYQDHLEDLVTQRTSELEEANQEFREAVARLEEHDRAKTQFVSNVSHELRTPLASMSNAVENLLRGVVGEVSPRVHTYLDMLKDDCLRLIGTVNDILDLSRIEAERLVLNRVTLPFARFARDSIEPLRSQAGERNITLTVHGQDSAGFVECDPQKMARVFVNVVQNAIKFTQEGGAIDIELEVRKEPEERFLVHITDSGIGIPPEHIGRVMERYYRVGEHVAGTGLGLALCKDIVEIHGGEVFLASPPPAKDRGTQVSMALPIAAPPLVLAIDDEAAMRELLQTQLAAYGYNVLTYSDGEDVVALLKEKQPGVLLVDLVLPGTDGVEIVGLVKSEHSLRNVPIVAVTGAELDRARVEILEGFAVPVLGKPWKLEELLTCIEDAMIGKQYVMG